MSADVEATETDQGEAPAVSQNDLARLDAEVWWRTYAKILTKEAKLVRAPKPNTVQRRMFAAYRECRAARKPCKMLVLKPRQVGASTVAQGITYHHNRSFPNLNGTLMGDRSGTSDKVFSIYDTYVRTDRFPWGHGPLSPKLLGTEDITLPNGSHYGKETAGSTNAGRGGTIQVGNMTEVAWFPVEQGKDPALGYLNSFYDLGEMSLGIADSTPNGPKGWFYDQWQDKTNGWLKIFAAWFEFPEHSREFEDDLQRAAFAKEMDEEEREEQIRYGLSLEQMHWRRTTIKDKCGGDAEKFKQEYPSNDIECFLKSMRPKFRLVTIEKMIERAPLAQPRVGEITLFQEQMRAVFTPDDAGTVEVFEEPKVGCRYIGAADTCTGEDQQAQGEKANPDYHSLGIIRAGYVDGRGAVVAPRLVCHHWSRLDADLAAVIMAGMSVWYGTCMVVPEVNACGLLMVKRLAELGIPVFRRSRVNRTAGTVDKHLGWKTDAVTRKTIIDNMAQLVREWKPEEPTFECSSLRVLGQCKTFVVSESGKPEAMPGTHDDDVLMIAIALYNLPAAMELKELRRKPVDLEKLMRREGWKRT